jgi:hypothetical protein
MRHTIALVILSFLVGLPTAAGQEWARKLFETTNHDFGTVARGSKQEFSFAVKNIYKEDIHLASVRSSCGCTSPRITKNFLKTGETSAVVAVLNTRSFLGTKGATITVVIDKPYYAEVQLHVSSYIRGDVVFHPGVVNLGSVDAGEAAETEIDVAYAGRESWQIVDVRSANRHFEVELEETQRGGGRVGYRMRVRLKPDAPAGYIQDQLFIVTNDSGSRSVPVPVEGQVVSPMTVSPASLFMGVLKPGQTTKKQLVVRGKKPFKITCVKCEDEAFRIDEANAESKVLHFLPVEYTAGEEPGNVVRKIEIETDLPGGLSAECVATATIQGDED